MRVNVDVNVRVRISVVSEGDRKGARIPARCLPSHTVRDGE